MVGWINQKMNLSDEVWMWVHKNYGMSRIVKKQFGQNKKMHLPWISDNGWFNQWNNEQYWWSMKVSESKVWNE